jgi:membrane protease YdiL (CAAX protease family)
VTLEILFAGVVVIALPLRAWRRHVRKPAAPTRYLIETVLLTMLLAGLLWRRGVALDALGLRPSGPSRLLSDLAVCVGMVVSIDVWSWWRTMRQLRRAALQPAQYRVAPETPAGNYADALAGRQALGRFTAVVLVGAVWEELCFRGVVLLLVPHTPAGLAFGVVGGSLIFGAQHLRNGLAGAAYATCFGVMFALLYLATGNLIAVMAAHAAGNMLAAAQWAPRIEQARQAAQRRQAPIFLG